MSAGSFVDSPRCWAVAFSMMIYTFFAMAVLKSSSVLYVGSMQMLDLSREEASWPATLAVMLSQLAGPAYGIMLKFTSERGCLIFGALLCSLPLMGAAWATSVTMLCILVGVIQGFGAACSEVIPFVVLMKHFQKYRGTVISAMYIIMAVSGFAMPVLYEYVRQTWDFRVCLFVMGAVNLGMLLGCIIVNRVPDINETSPTNAALPTTSQHFAEVSLSSDNYLVGSILFTKSQQASVFAHRSLLKRDNQIRAICRLPSSRATRRDAFHRFASWWCQEKFHEFSRQRECKDCNLSLSRSLQLSRTGSFVDIDSLREKTPLMLSLISRHSEQGNKPKSAGLLSLTFIHITISRAATVFALAAFLLILLDYAADRQLDSVQGVLVLTVFTVGDLLSRVLSGSLIDLRLVAHSWLMSATFLIQGASYLLLMHVELYGVILMAVFLVGLTGGCRNVLATVMVTEECDESSLALNLGVMNFVTGLAIFFQPLIIGFVRDSLGSYEPLLLAFVIINMTLFATWFIHITCGCRKYLQDLV